MPRLMPSQAEVEQQDLIVGYYGDARRQRIDRRAIWRQAGHHECARHSGVADQAALENCVGACCRTVERICA